MKKLFTIVLAATAISAFSAHAQYFNHLSLGVTLGDDGLGFEVAAPVGNYFQLRGGYSFVPYTYKSNFDIPDANMGGVKRDLSNLPMSFKLWEGGLGKLYVDFYPWSEGIFRITAGAYVGSGKLITMDADFTNVLRKDEYGTLGIGTDKFPDAISTDQSGFIHAHVMTNKVLPYLGLGLGRGLPKKRVSFTFDLGVLYTGGIKPQSYNYIRNTLDPSVPVNVVPITSNAIDNVDEGLVDQISAIPVFPMMKIGLYVRLF